MKNLQIMRNSVVRNKVVVTRNNYDFLIISSVFLIVKILQFWIQRHIVWDEITVMRKTWQIIRNYNSQLQLHFAISQFFFKFTFLWHEAVILSKKLQIVRNKVRCHGSSCNFEKNYSSLYLRTCNYDSHLCFSHNLEISLLQFLDTKSHFEICSCYYEENIANCQKQYSSEKKSELRQTVITFLAIVRLQKNMILKVNLSKISSCNWGKCCKL